MDNGWIAWIGLISYIVAYDTWAIRTNHETMSHACWDTKITGKCGIGLATVLVGKHLLFPNWLPSLDPIGLCAKLIRYGKR